MRIVKPGVLPHDLYGSCDRCEAAVEAMYDDEEVTKSFEEHNCGFTVSYSLRCPTEGCGERIELRKVRKYEG